MLESDPALPLDQDVVSNLITKFAGLTAQRQLQDSELSEIPAWSDTPLMVFEIASGETARTLTVDQANDVADIYYVYDENGTPTRWTRPTWPAFARTRGICTKPDADR